MTKIDDKTFSVYDNMIRQEVHKLRNRTANQRISFDDYVQDAWVWLLQRFENGNLPAVDGNGNIENGGRLRVELRNFFVDSMRYDMRRNTWSLDTSSDDSDYKDTSLDDHSFGRAEDMFDYNELINLFPEGSPEREYIKFCAESRNLQDFGFNPPQGRESGGYTNSYISNLLGFGGTGNRRWKRFLNNLRSIVRDYRESDVDMIDVAER